MPQPEGTKKQEPTGSAKPDGTPGAGSQKPASTDNGYRRAMEEDMKQSLPPEAKRSDPPAPPVRAEASPADTPPPEPPVEAPVEGEEAPAEEPAPDAEEPKPAEDKPEGLTPKQQKAFDKRIGKEVARRHDLEEQLEAERTSVKELRARVQELEQTPQGDATSATSDLFAVDSEAKLEAREDYLWQWEKFCLKNPDGFQAPEGTQARSYTAEEIRDTLLQVREERERVLPRARQALAKRLAVEPQVQRAYPELSDARSDAGVELTRVLRQVPGLRAMPEYKLWVGDAIAGRKLRLAKAAKPGGEKPPTKLPPAPPAPAGGSGSPRTAGAQVQKPNEQKRLEILRKGNYSDDALEESYRASS